MRLKPSEPITNLNISYACVTDSEQWGYGVYSWHLTEADARHNAYITRGVVVPVDTMNGEVLVPSLAEVILQKRCK